jgi:hypothetical protein
VTPDEAEALLIRISTITYGWMCPKCKLKGDEQKHARIAREDLLYHFNEDHKGED